MADPSEERRLFREAADLAIRLQNDPANPVSVQMARAWADRSPDHMAAWARVAEIHGMTGKILADQRKAGATGRLSRRSFVVGGMVGLGTVGAGSLMLPDALMRLRADHFTQTAEIRRVELPDSSVMTLGPDSAVAVSYSDTRRTISLLAGMAYFEVANDRLRPFSTVAGPVTAVALGTAFDMSSDAGFVTVSVEHGVVETRAPDEGAGGAGQNARERLEAGQWITFAPSQGPAIRGSRDLLQIAAWRGGMIVAEQETVSAMVARISRWIPGRVVVADPSLGRRVVSGVFDLRDPMRALEAVARPFGAKVRGIGSVMTVISSI